MPSTLRRRSLGTCAALVLLGASAPVLAQARAPVAAFDIPAQNLAAALRTFARQSGQQVIFQGAAARGRTSVALKGGYGADAGLDILLRGTGLTARRGERGVIIVEEASSSPQLPAAPVAAETVSEVLVTGSLIRGGESPSPLHVVSREDLERSGRATIAEVLTDLPQAFGGNASADTYLANTDGSGNNANVSTGINLRGLGPSSTLVLVNGRRMAGTGFHGDFADVSAIPSSAVARVDVLLDGASALYGTDAVGGVVNIILRDDFQGQESRVRVGAAAGDKARELRVDHTGGWTWGGGHLVLSYEHYERDALPAEARAYTATADLRALGGTDHRLFYSHPGNIMLLDATSSYIPAYAIPAGQNGLGLTPASFRQGQVNLENQRARSDMLPRQERDSLFASFGQAVTPGITVRGDARFSRRDFAHNLPGTVALIAVDRRNPFFVSPNGATSSVVGYSFTDELGPIHSDGRSDNFGASLGVDIDLPRGWQAETYLAYASEAAHRDVDRRYNSRFLQEAMGMIPDDPTTSFSTAVSGFFNPYGDGAANSAAILDFVGSGWSTSKSRSRVESVNVKVDGALFDLPGGPVKIAVGGQLRRERFQFLTVGMTSRTVPTVTLAGPYDSKIAAGFVEVRAPLFGPANRRPGLERLELSLAARIEHYDDVGSTRNPKVGVLWSPMSDILVRGSYGTSFRAPSLAERFETEGGGGAYLNLGGVQKLVLLRYGGNVGLKPEHARSWTAGVDYTPAAVPGLHMSAGWFNIRFRDRIGTPVYDDITNALGSPVYATFVTRVDPTSTTNLASVSALLEKYGVTGQFPANAYYAVVDGRYLNTGGLRVEGVDLSANYGFDVGADHFDVDANATYLTQYRRKVTPDAPAFQLLDRPGQPVDLRAQMRGSWRRGPYGASVTLNYTDDYGGGGVPKIDSLTTVDLQLRWTPPSKGALAGVDLSLSVQNLFNTAPPFYDSPAGVGYDTANAEPLGRFVSVQLTKAW